ncbi:MAG TPA: hypothetical protein VHD36_14940 [Pirellulales bacterium]|nr:hypothetical protein [Pirellulales bacterium]
MTTSSTAVPGSSPTSGDTNASRIDGCLLVTSWCVPPNLTGSSVIVDGLSQQFRRDEMVIIGQNWRTLATYERSAELPELHYFGNEWTWPRRGQRYVRWLRWFTLPALVSKIKRMARERNATAILAIFPNEYFLLASYIAAKQLQLPLYPFLHNTYIENRTGRLLRLAKWLEPRVFRTAPVVFVANDGMRAHYEKIHPGLRFESLVHTFNEPIPEYEAPPAPGNPVKLAFQGNLNESNIDAARRLAEIVNRREDYVLTTYSGTPDWFFAKVGVCGPRIKHTRVASNKVVEALRGEDILLLPHGLTGGLSQVEYDTIFPTRTVPNLLAMRPIVAHSPPNCNFTRWLKETDCAEVIDQPDSAALEQAIERVRHDAARREQLVRNGLAVVGMFHAPVVAGKLKRIVAETMPASPSRAR